jgi:mRNA interferase YafQ
MLILKYTARFKRDYKLAKKRGLDIRLLDCIIEELANQRQLEQKYQDHPLSGDCTGFRECHIQPD